MAGMPSRLCQIRETRVLLTSLSVGSHPKVPAVPGPPTSPTWLPGQGSLTRRSSRTFSRARIVAWAVPPSLTMQAPPMQALNMVTFMTTVGATLNHHGDRGVQYVSLAYSKKLAELGRHRIGGLPRRLVRHRSGGVRQRGPQSRTDPRAQALTHDRGSRTGDPGMGPTGSIQPDSQEPGSPPAEVEHGYCADHTRAPTLATT